MPLSAEAFYARIKSKITKDSDLPNFFVYYLTIECNQPAATVSAVKTCYVDCDLHPPTWLASHFSAGLKSKPRRFIRVTGGYRLEDKIRQTIAAALESNRLEDSESQFTQKQLAGIEYFGIAGSSKDCKNAILRFLQFGDEIRQVLILTHQKQHALLINSSGDPIAIKSGFTSGYGGEGPRALSFILQLLNSHGAEIEEKLVDADLIERVDQSALTTSDLELIDNTKPIRPSQWHTYISEADFMAARDGKLWASFPPIIPFAVIDNRIIDLARSFWKDPDDRLMKGYRRLEDIVRDRTGIVEHGTKLFSQAFVGNNPKLTWKDIDGGERTGRGNLFTAAFQAHRNPRAHRELKGYEDVQLVEFLMLNHLFLLEREAIAA